jgi:hypothetical protein
VNGGERDSGAGAPALFTRPGTGKFFLFRRVKVALEGMTLDQESLKNAWEGVTRNTTAEDYTTAFLWWCERVKKCVWISSNLVKKN